DGPLAVAADGDRVHLVLVSGPRRVFVDFLSRLGVPEPQSAVPASGQGPLAARKQGDARDPAEMAVELRRLGALPLQVPQLESAVRRRGREGAAGAERQRRDVALMTHEAALLLPFVRAPHLPPAPCVPAD